MGEDILPGSDGTPPAAALRGAASDTLDPLRLAAAIARLAPSKAQARPPHHRPFHRRQHSAVALQDGACHGDVT